MKPLETDRPIETLSTAESPSKRAYPHHINIPVKFVTGEGYDARVALTLEISSNCNEEEFESVQEAVLKACTAMVSCFDD